MGEREGCITVGQREVTMLSIRNVHKSFGDNEVLKGVSLEVSKGDVVVILGPSGSGKTTLLRSINFLEAFDQIVNLLICRFRFFRIFCLINSLSIYFVLIWLNRIYKACF